MTDSPSPAPGSSPMGRPLPAKAVLAPPVIAGGASGPPPHLHVDGYRIDGLMGGGAMGDVYRATQVSLDRQVAIKVLAAGADRPEVRERFRREAQVLAKLSDHPNIVTVYDHGIMPGGQAYIVMALVAGETLETWLARRWLPAGGLVGDGRAIGPIGLAVDADEPLRVFAKICHAVGAAHAEGIVHRDLKPANVMVDRRGEPQVLDFGIARLLSTADDGPAAAATLTQLGTAIGTPLYASPEQAMFDPGLITARSDVYSLGVILYKILTGGLYPYPVTDADRDPWRVFDVVRRGEVIRPRDRVAAARRAGTAAPALPLPAWDDRVEAVLLRALSKRPEDRQATADELGHDLSRCLGGGPAAPPPAWRPAVAAPPAPTPVAGDRRTAAGRGGRQPFVNSVGMSFVRIEPGTFVMGSPKGEIGRCPDEIPHRVTLTRGFHLAVTPVTQAQWQAALGADDNPSQFRGDDLPVEQVSWDEAAEFCRRLGGREGRRYRLPTEAEWEYACRAGTTTPFNTGKTIRTDQANFDGDEAYGPGLGGGGCRGTTTPVGSFPANLWGLRDMHGNVWEWCAVWYGPYGKGREKDPVGPAAGEQRVVRGGSWSYGPRVCRSAFRGRGAPGQRTPHVGFRVAMDLDQAFDA
jgi:formylglycine-generating enzyme required for sulfatase activity/tRNA A-37 threonylcarbamoyl transferase component Bud32